MKTVLVFLLTILFHLDTNGQNLMGDDYATSETLYRHIAQSYDFVEKIKTGRIDTLLLDFPQDEKWKNANKEFIDKLLKSETYLQNCLSKDTIIGWNNKWDQPEIRQTTIQFLYDCKDHEKYTYKIEFNYYDKNENTEAAVVDFEEIRGKSIIEEYFNNLEEEEK